MRVGVIRGDLPGPLMITDVESVSQYNPPTEPRGQERYIGRPDLYRVAALLLAMESTASAADVIAGSVPVGGPIDVSSATLKGLVGGSPTDAQVAALADALAPWFVETDAVIKSFQVGGLSLALKGSFNPDPSRLPKLANGPAIAVVEDDGKTPFAAPITEITGAVHDSPNPGDITVTGTNLGNPERMDTSLRVTASDNSKSLRLTQAVLVRTNTNGTQGSVSPTTVVIPASLLNELGVAGSKIMVQFTSLASSLFTVT